MAAEQFQREVSGGERFEFGKNWQRFLSVLDDERIDEARRSLVQMLEIDTLAGMTFLDVGSGSGLFSLCAMHLSADRVHSFDFDPQSVACTSELKKRYFPDTVNWVVQQGSVLDRQYLNHLGKWDVVYSWGVLHHTGSMWDALQNVVPLVKSDGILYISIYNDQRFFSRFWTGVKVFTNRGRAHRISVLMAFVPYFVARGFVGDVLKRNNPFLRARDYKKSRGMSMIHDWLDWLGGYPFEVAKPEAIFDFFRAQGFSLQRIKTVGGGLGCNEYVFRKS